MAFQNLKGEEVDAPIPAEAVDPYKGLPVTDRALMGMVDVLGYTMNQAAKVLRITSKSAHRRYWKNRAAVRPKKLLRDELLARSPELLSRDLCALEMVTVLNYSIGRAARILGINKGHLCRRIAIAKQLIQEAGDPRA